MLTKKRPSKKAKSGSDLGMEELRRQLDQAKAELTQVHKFFDRLQTFSNIVNTAKQQIGVLKTSEHKLKEQLSEVRSEIRSIENLIDSSNDGMLAVLEPGPSEFLPLFDTMEKADPDTHGVNAVDWREKPISVLRLSPVASNSLIEAGIVFIGQLQDRIIEDPDDWWQGIDGLNEVIAAAIADKLADFVSKGGEA